MDTEQEKNRKESVKAFKKLEREFDKKVRDNKRQFDKSYKFNEPIIEK